MNQFVNHLISKQITCKSDNCLYCCNINHIFKSFSALCCKQYQSLFWKLPIFNEKIDFIDPGIYSDDDKLGPVYMPDDVYEETPPTTTITFNEFLNHLLFFASNVFYDKFLDVYNTFNDSKQDFTLSSWNHWYFDDDDDLLTKLFVEKEGNFSLEMKMFPKIYEIPLLSYWNQIMPKEKITNNEYLFNHIIPKAFFNSFPNNNISCYDFSEPGVLPMEDEYE